MIRSGHVLLALLLGLAGALLPAPDAEALTIFQEWRHPLYGLGSPPEGSNVTTNAVVDTSGLTGVGTENILLTSMVLIEWDFVFPSGPNVGQNAYSAQFTTPPSFTMESNIYAEFVNGAFNRLISVNTGGNGFVLLFNLNTSSVTAVMTVSGGILFYGTALSLTQYNLHSTTITPEPSALVLLAVGGIAVFALARQRRAA